MARHESDREDLFAELAALNPRIELRVGESDQTVCAGRKESTGGWSLYLTSDQVYHFDAEGRLRRAYMDGFLYRSEGSTLSRLRRERSATETTLIRHDLDAGELAGFLETMRSAITEFMGKINADQATVLRVSEAAEHVLAQLTTALEIALQSDSPLSQALRG